MDTTRIGGFDTKPLGEMSKFLKMLRLVSTGMSSPPEWEEGVGDGGGMRVIYMD